MKKTLRIAATLGAFISMGTAFSQAPTIEFAKTLGGNGNDGGVARQNIDGGFVFLAGSSSTDGDVTGNLGSFDVWVVNTDASGAILWKKNLGGSNVDLGYDIHPTTDGGYIIAGATYSNDGDVTINQGQYDCWIIKLTYTGDISWQKTYGGTGDDRARSINQTSDGGYIFTGYTTSYNTGDVTNSKGFSDIWVVKIDSDGTLDWQKTLGGSSYDEVNSEDEYIDNAIQQTADGGYIVAGRTYSTDGDVTSNHGTYDAWVVKLESDGDISWQKTIGGSSYDMFSAIQPTVDGGYIAAGTTNSSDGDLSTNAGAFDLWVVKLDASGNLQWQQIMGGAINESANSVKATLDGGYIVAGFAGSADGQVLAAKGGLDAWVIKLDGGGNHLWQKNIGGTGNEIAFNVNLTMDGGYVLGGYTNSIDGDFTLNQGAFDGWIVKLEAEPAGLTDFSETVFTSYPNPSSGKIVLTSDLTEAGSIVVTDISGRTVFAKETSDLHENVLDLSGQPSGLYLLNITAGKTVSQIKITIQ